jgi:hypothetical protein
LSHSLCQRKTGADWNKVRTKDLQPYEAGRKSRKRLTPGRSFKKHRLDKNKMPFRFMKIIRAIIACACLIVLCSCATRDAIRPSLPADTFFNKEAGRSQWIYLTLHLANGKELLFIVDTGAPGTVLDKSLEPILGKCLGKRNIYYPFFGKVTVNMYDAPKLYLGGTQLLMGNRIYTDDLGRLPSDRPLMGILGMDCLRHYCIQLDFAANRMCFLDPDHPGNENSCEIFPLAFSDGRPWIYTNFFGHSNSYYGVDTGCPIDVALKPKRFEQELRTLREQTSDQANFSVQMEMSAGLLVNVVLFPEIVLKGEAYTNFMLGDCPDQNLLGLRFLSRHQATLNFPKRTMYLQRSNGKPFAAFKVEVDELSSHVAGYAFTKEAEQFLSNLKELGKLPGWLKDERGQVSDWTPIEENPEVYPISRTFIATKKNEAFKYHYTVVKASKDGVWQLQRAWCTDSNGHILNEYPVISFILGK